MRKSIISAIVVGLSLAFVGCPPPANNDGGDGGETTTDGGETTTDGGDSQPADGGESAAADANADLSHVSVGQKYHFEMPNNMVSIWEVTEVGENMVKYKTTMLMDMGEGPAPVGEPQEQEWKYVAPEGTGEATGETMDVKTSREEMEISGIKFDCMVSETEHGKSWMTMNPGSDTVYTFPGAIKVLGADGSATMTLVKVE